MENDKVLLFYPMSFPSCHQKEFPFQVLKKKKKGSSIWTAQKRVSVCAVLTQIIPSPEKREPIFFWVTRPTPPPQNNPLNSPRKLVYKSNPLLFSLLHSFIYLSLSNSTASQLYLTSLSSLPLYLSSKFPVPTSPKCPAHKPNPRAD